MGTTVEFTIIAVEKVVATIAAETITVLETMVEAEEIVI